MENGKLRTLWHLATVMFLASVPAAAQSFRVQCPQNTITHPAPANTNLEPAYSGPTYTGTSGYPATPVHVNGAIKCQQISGGDGYATMADGTQTFMFSFGPLSGLADIVSGKPGTEFPNVFNTVYPVNSQLQPGDPATTIDANGPWAFSYNGAVGLAYDTDIGPTTIDGHVDPRQIMDIGVMNGNIPAPLIAIDEDDELFLTLSNVGMIMRPDLFEQHTVHFHGYPNASAFYDGVPDASVAINIGGSFTYYYLAPDAGTYFYHCHITPPEHLQMGMVGQLYVRPRQDRVPVNSGLRAALVLQQSDPRTACNTSVDNL
jgi:FtsP/CotA-like multicopper oxidase with cupredoxin domain